MVVGGSLSKTAVNGSAGARSQLSGLIVAVLTVVTLIFLTGLFEDLPEATLAAVVIAAVIGLVDIPALVRLYRVHSERLGGIYGPAARPDFIAAVAATLGVMVFDLLPGLFIGIAVSFLLLLYRSSHPHVARLGKVRGSDHWEDRGRNPDAEETPGIAVLRIEGELIFANADAVRTEIRRAAGGDAVTGVVVDGEAIPAIDVTAVEMLTNLIEELERAGVEVALAADVGQVRDVLHRTDAGDELRRLFPSVQEAVDHLVGVTGGPSRRGGAPRD